MRNLMKDISKTKQRLIKKVKKTGLYENFGQKEVRKLTDNHIDISSYTNEMNQKRSLLDSFDDWCMSYEGS